MYFLNMNIFFFLVILNLFLDVDSFKDFYNGTSCNDFVNKSTCTWNKDKNNVNILINKNMPCVFKCSYSTVKKNGGPIKLTVRLKTSWLKSDVFTTVEQKHDNHAYRLPIFFSDLGKDQPYTSLEKVFCPPQEKSETIYFRITSLKQMNISIDLKPTPNIIQKLSENVTTNPTPTTATVLSYFWKSDDQQSVLITATDSSETGKYICAIFSLQNAQCPYNTDKASIIAGGGKYQTILSKGGLVGKRTDFPDGINIIVLPLPTNQMCLGDVKGHFNRSSRVKSVEITVQPHMVISQNWGKFLGVGLFVTFIVGAMTYVTRFFISRHFGQLANEDSLIDAASRARLHLYTFMRIFNEESDEAVNDDYLVEAPDDGASTLEPTDQSYPPIDNLPQPPPTQALLPRSEQSSGQIQERFLQFTDSFNPRYVFWWKSVEICDRSKSTDVATLGFKKNLLLMALFMALPFAELIRSYVKVFSYGGIEDSCYFNSRCVVSFWIFPDFSLVFTNIGYLLCSGSFVYIVTHHTKQANSFARKLNVRTVVGVSRNYELFKAMGYAMLAQCVMSSMYHICPNEVTLRFDMLFIYILAMLLIIGTWGLRHGNAAEHIYSSAGLIGCALLLAELEELFPSWLFWLVIGAVQTVIGVATSYFLTNFGTFSFSPFSMLEILKKWKPIVQKMNIYISNQTELPDSTYRGTALRIAVGNLANFSLIFLGAFLDMDIYKYILLVCLVFMTIYVINYLISKLIYEEKFLLFTLAVFGSAFVLWILSLVFFLMKNVDTDMQPSSSRIFNGDCVLFGIFSYHDLWHLFSALSLFLTLIGILTMDDNLNHVPSENIPVF